jgi:hypothetical protein
METQEKTYETPEQRDADIAALAAEGWGVRRQDCNDDACVIVYARAEPREP